MILADTSVWVDHLRHVDPAMVSLLNERLILGHPFVTGEIALGRLPRRDETLASLEKLPQAVVADPAEVLRFIDARAIYGSGVSYVDVHLLTSAILTPEAHLWTRDKKLRAVAERFSVAASRLD